ncbi:MAG TPA: hypothetical protein VL356_02710 [Acidocella sp.]|jgi:hypothetical protein|nr:hypothetical protein [Acidocella sp.]
MAKILKFAPHHGRAEMVDYGRRVPAPGDETLRTLRRDRVRAVWRQDANGRLYIQWKIDNDATF